jgi:hypothetical protein
VPGDWRIPSCANAQIWRSSAFRYSSRSGSTASMPVNPDDRIHLDVRPHGGGAGPHGEIERTPGAGADVVDREVPLGLAGEPDRLVERAPAGRHAVVQQRLVEMNVGLDQPWGDDATAEVDRLSCPDAVRVADAGDEPVLHHDVHGSVTIRELRAAKDEIGGHAPFYDGRGGVGKL